VAALAVGGCGRLGFAPQIAGDSDATTSDATPSDGTPSDAAPADAAAAIRMLAHTITSSQGANLTTAPIDTTGASLIVLAECTYSTGAPKPPTDSRSNTWQTGLSSYGANNASATHSFVDPGNDFLSMAVVAFSGTRTTPAVLDSATGSTGSATFLAGTVTPSQAGELVVAFACSGDSVATAISMDDGFVVTDRVLNGSAGDPEDMASAFLIAAAAAIPFDPSWSFPGDTKVTGAIAAFAHP
jgi:hypothetical protein